MPAAEIRFGADHPVAAGHFPGNPIIPGALLLDEILCALGRDGNGPVLINAAKFFRPLLPGETLRVEWQGAAGGAQKFECFLSGSEVLVASGTIDAAGAA